MFGLSKHKYNNVLAESIRLDFELFVVYHTDIFNDPKFIQDEIIIYCSNVVLFDLLKDPFLALLQQGYKEKDYISITLLFNSKIVIESHCRLLKYASNEKESSVIKKFNSTSNPNMKNETINMLVVMNAQHRCESIIIRNMWIKTMTDINIQENHA